MCAFLQVLIIVCSCLIGLTVGLISLVITEKLAQSVTVSEILHNHEGGAN